MMVVLMMMTQRGVLLTCRPLGLVSWVLIQTRHTRTASGSSSNVLLSHASSLHNHHPLRMQMFLLQVHLRAPSLPSLLHASAQRSGSKTKTQQLL